MAVFHGKGLCWTGPGKPCTSVPVRPCAGGGRASFSPLWRCWPPRQSQLVPALAKNMVSRWPNFPASRGEILSSSCGQMFRARCVPRMTHTATNKADDAPVDFTGEVARAPGRSGTNIEPSVWGDFFATYSPSPSQKSEEWMRERAEQLKDQVRQMFVHSSKSTSIADTLSLIDEIEHLGIDSHFRKEIDTALSRVHSEEMDFDSSNDMHMVALRFCLLRQHGFWVSTDVFDKYRDSTGHFKLDLTKDPRGLMSLYNAANMAVPGETILDEAIAFTRCYLQLLKGKCKSPMAEQVSRTLELPRYRSMQRLEAIHYITEYEQDEVHDVALLELAKLDFNITRSVHLEELRSLTLWWRDLSSDLKLAYTRDRLVESFFYALGIFHEEENFHARIMLTKVSAILTPVDDTFDNHAPLEECQILDEAIQRWDLSMVPVLPEYMRMLYIKLLKTFDEIEDMLEPWEKYRMAHVLEELKVTSKAYLKQAEWFSKNYTPSFKEHVDLSSTSTTMLLTYLVVVMGMFQTAVTNEAFDWALSKPGMIHAVATKGRFLNDIASYKLGKSKGDMISSIECYIKEHGVTEEDAMVAFATMVDQWWKRINLAYIELDRSIQPIGPVVVNMARVNQTLYHQGRDVYTFGSTLKEIVTSLLLKDFPV